LGNLRDRSNGTPEFQTYCNNVLGGIEKLPNKFYDYYYSGSHNYPREEDYITEFTQEFQTWFKAQLSGKNHYQPSHPYTEFSNIIQFEKLSLKEEEYATKVRYTPLTAINLLSQVYYVFQPTPLINKLLSGPFLLLKKRLPQIINEMIQDTLLLKTDFNVKTTAYSQHTIDFFISLFSKNPNSHFFTSGFDYNTNDSALSILVKWWLGFNGSIYDQQKVNQLFHRINENTHYHLNPNKNTMPQQTKSFMQTLLTDMFPQRYNTPSLINSDYSFFSREAFDLITHTRIENDTLFCPFCNMPIHQVVGHFSDCQCEYHNKLERFETADMMHLNNLFEIYGSIYNNNKTTKNENATPVKPIRKPKKQQTKKEEIKTQVFESTAVFQASSISPRPLSETTKEKIMQLHQQVEQEQDNFEQDVEQIDEEHDDVTNYIGKFDDSDYMLLNLVQDDQKTQCAKRVADMIENLYTSEQKLEIIRHEFNVDYYDGSDDINRENSENSNINWDDEMTLQESKNIKINKKGTMTVTGASAFIKSTTRDADGNIWNSDGKIIELGPDVKMSSISNVAGSKITPNHLSKELHDKLCECDHIESDTEIDPIEERAKELPKLKAAIESKLSEIQEPWTPALEEFFITARILRFANAGNQKTERITIQYDHQTNVRKTVFVAFAKGTPDDDILAKFIINDWSNIFNGF
jgi:hypothetical protein